MAAVQSLGPNPQPLPFSGRPSSQYDPFADQGSSSRGGFFEIPFHGSCSRCHHFHTNKPLHLPLDTQQHTRFNCDHCEHPIIGIGRTSTQTTLASVETDAAEPEPQRRDGDAETATDLPTFNLPTQLRPLRLDTLVNTNHLSTISEGVSPTPQSSTAFILPRSDNPASQRPVSQNWAERPQAARHQAHGTTKHIASQSGDGASEHEGSRPPGSFWASASERSFRSKIRRHLWKPRSFTISRLRLHIDVSPTPAAPPIHSPLALDADHHDGRDRRTSHRPTSMHGTALDTDTNADSPHVDARNLVSASPPEPIQPPEPGHPDQLIDHTATQRDKYERIRARRREATLKRKAELIARCECRSDCQCRNNGSFRSNAASYRPEGSDRSIQVPDHPLGSMLTEGSESSADHSSSSIVRALDLTGIDGHVHFNRRTPSMDDPPHVANENRGSLDDRLSQASTAYLRSNGSSISLISRRPSSLMRSLTAPGYSSRRPPDGLRPHVVEALQDRNIPDQVRGSVSQRAGSSRSSESNARENSITAPEVSAEGPGESPTHGPDPQAPP
ncbi:MAG: hypothetical protein Q9219_004732 [cf. Caloplaca sp. 3 TL-2023]